MNSSQAHVADRYIDEKLGDHWRVDDTPESFLRLTRHLDTVTNFRVCFEQAMDNLARNGLPEGAVVADIGAGVGWTSALMARRPEISRVYVVDPSANRLTSARAVAQHYDVPADKIAFVDGTFEQPNLPEPVDLVLLCGAFHHCWDRDVPALFANLRRVLKPGTGRILIANEHYVTWVWVLRRMISWLLGRAKRDGFWGPGRWRAPNPWSSEHWRTRGEVARLFAEGGFDVQWGLHDIDVCGAKHGVALWGWQYYYAVLTPRM